MTTRTRLHRWCLALSVGLTSAVGIGNLAGWIPEMFRSLQSGEVDGVTGGTDFAMFRAAAVLASDGRWSEVYSLDGLAESMSATFGGVSFAYPPPFAMLLEPLVNLAYPTALAVWLGIGVVAVVSLISQERWYGLLGLASMLFPSYIALRFGQFVPLAVLILAVAGWNLRAGRHFVAGLFVGLLVLKPQFLVGPLVVLLATRREHPMVLRGALTSSIGVVGATVLADFGAWRAFLRGITDVTAPGVSTRWDFSILSATGTLPSPLQAVVAVIAVVALTALVVRLASRSNDVAEIIALGIALSVLLSPRVVAYDWMLLVVAVAWIGRNVTIDSPLVILGGTVALASLSGYAGAGCLAWLTLAAFVIGAALFKTSHLSIRKSKRQQVVKGDSP